MTAMRLMPQTIRGQITMAFAVCFIFMAGVIGVSYFNFRQLTQSLDVLETAEQLNNTILEIRRYEKNYLLFRQDFNYEENLSYSSQLRLILEREKETLVDAIGDASYAQFIRHTEEYEHLMGELHRTDCSSDPCDEVRAEIRGIGQSMIILADQLVTTERRAIHRQIQKLVSLPIFGLLALVILMGFVVFFIGERVVRPLARITRESGAVAEGSYRQITPYGGVKNEIHVLVSAINRMVTELESRQEQLVQSRKIASLGTLSAGIAHEINNPLNNISLILESMLEESGDIEQEDFRQLLQDAMGQADRASDIVKNLLEFSRTSHGKPEDVDLKELVDKTARLMRNEFDLHRIRFESKVEQPLSHVHLEQGSLQQVLLNLFMNSIQAMDDGGELRVVLGRSDHTNEARIDVIDNGPGILPEIREQIFDPFFTTKKEGIGTGLGLSVSYSIITKNGGRMEVESEPGKGACFSIFLPFPDGGGVRI
jgi:signal transduction histidine kinase